MRQLFRADYIRDRINQVARSLFVMTNGKQKLRNVYVFNQKLYGENVDIQLINKEGRSYATGFSGFGFEGYSTYNFLGMNTAESNQVANVVTENFLGQVVAHELGHYFLGLADEYAESNKAVDPNNPGAPASTDNARDTIMNNHEASSRLSTAEDYTASTQTAQSRVYKLNNNNQGASAWETLIRDPALDSTVAKSDAGHNGRRKWFAAFKQLTTPTVAELRTGANLNSTATENYDTDLKIIFKSSNAEETWTSTSNGSASSVSNPRQRKLILIDRTLPEAAFNEAIATARAMLAKEATVGTNQAQYAVLALPQASETLPTFSSNTTEIQDRIAALPAIARATTGTFDLLAAYPTIAQVIPAPVATSATTDSLEILTRQGATAPSVLADEAKKNKLALNIVGFRLPAGTPAVTPVSGNLPLANLSKQTGGEYNTAKNAQEATREMAKAAAAQSGKVLNLIDAESHPALGANGVAATSFYLSPPKYDGNFVVINWYFDPADADKLAFQWRGADGNIVGVQNTEGFTINKTIGVASFKFFNATTADNPIEYVMRVQATGGATVDGVDMEVSSDASTATNPISLSGAVLGGSTGASTSPVITMRFGGSSPIKGGEVKATILRNADGTVALENQVMLDDGQGADERANDGVYTLNLDGKLPAGEYTALVSARTIPGTSTFSSNQIQVGTNGAAPTRSDEVINDEVERMASVDFNLEAGAQGVGSTTATPGASASSSDSGGGGCTAMPGQADASLVGLVLGAAGLTAWRRRQRQR